MRAVHFEYISNNGSDRVPILIRASAWRLHQHARVPAARALSAYSLLSLLTSSPIASAACG